MSDVLPGGVSQIFLAETKSIITQALVSVFGINYPVGDFRDLWVSIEYPKDEQSYPGVWVGFEPVGQVSRGGIDNAFVPPPPSLLMGNDPVPAVYRWRAQGYATYTLAAMTSLQRDRLFDEVLKVITASRDPAHSNFRAMIEDNPLIAMNMDFDQVQIRNVSENAGTPWETMDIVYESTLAVSTQIEFYSDTPTSEMVPISAIEIIASGPIDYDITVPPGG
jgi:hypothetical protein